MTLLITELIQICLVSIYIIWSLKQNKLPEIRFMLNVVFCFLDVYIFVAYQYVPIIIALETHVYAAYKAVYPN